MFAYAPWWPGMIVVLMALLGGVLPDEQTPEPSREQRTHEQVTKVFDEMKVGVALRDAQRYLQNFSPEMRKTVERGVRSVLESPKRHNLVMRVKGEAVTVGSYEATYKVKIVTESLCDTGYRSNVEYATVTLAPVPESDEGKFFSQPSNDPADMRWEITKWETQKVVPYDREKD